MTYTEKACQLFLYKNGRGMRLSAYSDARSVVVDSGSMSSVLDLMMGDRVWVHNEGCFYLFGGQYVSFSGCKV